MTKPIAPPPPIPRLRAPIWGRYRAASPQGAALKLAGLALAFVPLTAALSAGFIPAKTLADLPAAFAIIAICVTLFAAAATIAALTARRIYPHPRLGLCNTVTLFRAALIAALIAPLIVAGPPPDRAAWAITLIAALALALDGVDGWAARRSGLASNFGARFDMEVDAAFGLILSLLVWDSGKIGAWVIALGAMRYAFVVASWALPWLTAPLPARFSRKLVCVVQIGALIALIAPPVTGAPAVTLAIAATLALAWSFAVDTIWLAKNARKPDANRR